MSQAVIAGELIVKATVTIFFPLMQDDELASSELAILIPIWTLGGLSLVLALIGSIQRGTRIRRDWRLQWQAESKTPPATASN